MIIADGLKGTDEVLVPVEGGTYVKEAKIGRAVMDADIILSLNHFKGHELIRIWRGNQKYRYGCGSRAGKMEQHNDGKPQIDKTICKGCQSLC